MKIMLYPLVGILDLTSNLYNATSTYPEVAILLSGLLASCLIGAFYLGLPLSLLRTRAQKLRRLTLAERPLALILTTGVGLLAVGEILISPMLLIASSATIVLSSLTLAALITSRKIVERR